MPPNRKRKDSGKQVLGILGPNCVVNIGQDGIHLQAATQKPFPQKNINISEVSKGFN